MVGKLLVLFILIQKMSMKIPKILLRMIPGKFQEWSECQTEGSHHTATITVVFGIVICRNAVGENSMNIYYLVVILLILTSASSCSRTKPAIEQVNLHQGEAETKLTGINKEAAANIANQDLVKNHESPVVFNMVLCEQALFWRVIYDGGGPEYVIDKASGRILKKQTLPQAPTENTTSATARETEVNKQEAIQIARHDAEQTYGDKIDLNQFADIACEQSQVWRVILDYKLRPGEAIHDVPHGNFPKYVIDKKTGKILSKELD
jgi:hypothetical protein